MPSPATTASVLARETAPSLDAKVRWIDDLTGVLEAAMAAAQRREPLVVVTAPGAADLMQLPAEVALWTVRVDLSLRTGRPVAGAAVPRPGPRHRRGALGAADDPPPQPP